MPRGDATRGAGLSTYYEPRLLRVSSFPRGFHPRRHPPLSSPFRPLWVPLLLSVLPLSPCSFHDPTESPFNPRYFTSPRSPRCVYFIFLSSWDLSLFRTRHLECVLSPCTCTCINTHTYSLIYIRER